MARFDMRQLYVSDLIHCILDLGHVVHEDIPLPLVHTPPPNSEDRPFSLFFHLLSRSLVDVRLQLQQIPCLGQLWMNNRS